MTAVFTLAIGCVKVLRQCHIIHRDVTADGLLFAIKVMFDNKKAQQLKKTWTRDVFLEHFYSGDLDNRYKMKENKTVDLDTECWMETWTQDISL